MNTREIVSRPQRDEPPKPEHVMNMCGLDPKEWNIEKQTVNTWETTFKGQPIPLYQLKLWLVRKEPVAQWPELRGAKVTMWPDEPQVYASKKDELVVVVPDAQIGYKTDGTPLHDERALAIVGTYITEKQPGRVVLLGDMLDLPDWTDKFLVSPDFRNTTQPALDRLAQWIAEWRQYAGEVVYIEGNHEKRLRDAVVRHIPAMYGLRPAMMPEDLPPMYSLPYLLGLEQLDVEWVGNYPQGEYWINDNLRCTHAQQLGNRGGLTVAKSLIGARCSTIYGHAHRMESAHVTVRGRKGLRVYGSYCIGTLARLDGVVPSNAAECDWQQGFATVNVQGEYFQVHMHNIYNGNAVIDGELWEAR